MKERPYATIRRIAHKNTINTKDFVKYIFEQSDKLSLWLLGISLAAISLLVSSLNDVSKFITPHKLDVVFISLFISVVCGISYRVISVWYFILTHYALTIIESTLAENEVMNIQNILQGNETFYHIVLLNSEYQDMTGFIELYEKLDTEKKKQMYADIKAAYIFNINEAKQESDDAIEELADLYKKYLGINSQTFKKEYSLSKMNFTKNASRFFYFGFLLTFLFAVGYFIFNLKF